MPPRREGSESDAVAGPAVDVDGEAIAMSLSENKRKQTHTALEEGQRSKPGSVGPAEFQWGVIWAFTGMDYKHTHTYKLLTAPAPHTPSALLGAFVFLCDQTHVCPNPLSNYCSDR